MYSRVQLARRAGNHRQDNRSGQIRCGGGSRGAAGKFIPKTGARVHPARAAASHPKVAAADSERNRRGKCTARKVRIMGDGFQFLDIVLFAMVAAFLVLRLRSVLGRRTGHEQQRRDPISQGRGDKDAEGNVVELPNRNKDRAVADEPTVAPIDPNDPLAGGLTKIQIADNSFDPAGFAQGAKAAFEMIVQAYAEGDKKTLRNLLADDVYDGFSEAIDQRAADGRTLETTIIGIKSSKIVEADLNGSDAVVSVKFVSEQVNVTRDSEDRVVEGDPNQVTEITDIWTFSRDTKSRDPNWKLVETSSQS